MKDLATSIFTISPASDNQVDTGKLLIADPSIDEAYFHRSVISIVDYSHEEGALGLVMNVKTGHSLDEFINGVDVSRPIPVYCGGPLGMDRLVLVHTLGPNFFPGSKEFAPGIFIGGDFETILKYVNDGFDLDGVGRFYLGYCGWTTKQLNAEIADRTWAVGEMPADVSTLFEGDGYQYWRREVRDLGESFRPWGFFPEDVASN